MTVLGRSRAFQRRQGGPGVVAQPAGVRFYGRGMYAEGSPNGIAWGGPAGSEKWVLVCDSGDNAQTVMWSSDGSSWNKVYTLPGIKALDVEWFARAGLFITAPKDGKYATSPDGINWQVRVFPDTGLSLFATSGGPPGQELFFAYNNVNALYVTADGISWTSIPLPFTPRTAAWSPLLGMWYMLPSSGGPSGAVSTDGISWTLVPVPAAGGWVNGITWGGPPGAEVFVAMINFGAPAGAYYSPDGVSWSPCTIPGSSWWSVYYGGPPGAQVFLASRIFWMSGINKLAISVDGITWSDSLTPYDTGAFLFATGSSRFGGPTGNRKWINTGPLTFPGQKVIESADASSGSWSLVSTPIISTPPALSSNAPSDIAYGGPAGAKAYVSCGQTNGQPIVYSPDLINFSEVPLPDPTCAYNSVVWGGPAGSERFVMVGSSGGSRVITSTDGLTWGASTIPASNQWYSVAWGGPVGSEVFVAVSQDGTNRAMTSPDGLTWTLRTPPAISYTFVAWGGPPGGELFVAVSQSGAQRIATSPDGVTWTLRGPTISAFMFGVSWSNDIGLWVAVGDVQSYYSADGITWLAGNPYPAGVPAVYGIAAGGTPARPLFVASAAITQGGSVIFSRDGINWQKATKDSFGFGFAWKVRFINSRFVVISQGGNRWCFVSEEFV